MSSIIPTLLLAGQAASTAGADTGRKHRTRADIGRPPWTIRKLGCTRNKEKP
ncbi:hypothetical protein SAMN05216344_12116 [Polaromonas sp. OV174]|nr:hypothetical protein SAMN05216344_12116 [Polaromonas sp. OV174]